MRRTIFVIMWEKRVNENVTRIKKRTNLASAHEELSLSHEDADCARVYDGVDAAADAHRRGEVEGRRQAHVLHPVPRLVPVEAVPASGPAP